jgi:cytochrome c-type biogenesis protein
MSGVQQLVLSGPLILAVPVAAAAGAVTFLSPCCLPLVPGYLSYVTGMSGADAQQRSAASDDSTADATSLDMTQSAGSTRVAVDAPPAVTVAAAKTTSGGRARRRALTGTALFVLGFSALFASYGAALGSVGDVLKTHDKGLLQVFGGVTIILGLLFAGAFDRFSFAGRMVRPSVRPRAGLAGAPLLGVMFGLGWTPCIGPTLATVEGLSLSTGSPWRGAFLAFVYGLGLGLPFLFVSLALERGMRALGFARTHARRVTQVGGAMLILVGVLEVTGAWSAAVLWMQTHWTGTYTSPL